MGRPESPVAGNDPALAGFASDLRELRQAAGRPAYRELARKANYSATVLSQAASGHVMPSLAVTLAFVAACGGDEAYWRSRWTTVSVQQEYQPVPFRDPGDDERLPTVQWPAPAQDRMAPAGDDRSECDATGGPSPETGPGMWQERRGWPGAARWLGGRPATLAAALGVVLVAGAGVGGAVVGAAVPSDAARMPADAGSTGRPVQDGADPIESGCAGDAVTVEQAPVFYPVSRFVGSLELRYSASCQGVWTRFDPSPPSGMTSAATVTVRVRRPAVGIGIGVEEEFTTRYADQSVYGDVLRANSGCVGAVVQVRTPTGSSPEVSSGCWSPHR